MIVALFLVMAFADPRFFRLQNLMIILQDASIFMVLATGMTLVITGRGIDLSVGSVATLSAVIMAMLIKDAGLNVFVGMAVAVLVGIACGSVNGFVVTKLRVPDLIATLSTDLVFRGLALVLAAGVVLARFPDPLTWIGRGRIIDRMPVAAVIGVIVIAVGYVSTSYWPGGRGRSPTRGSHRSGRAQLRHPAPRIVVSLLDGTLRLAPVGPESSVGDPNRQGQLRLPASQLRYLALSR